MKKRLLAVLLCAVMTLTLGACGDSNTDDTEKEITQPSVTKMADYSNISAILEEVADANAREYFRKLVFDAGIGIVEVKDRDVVQAGDIVATDYTGYVDGVAFKGGSTISDGVSNPQWIDVSNNCGMNVSTGAATSGYIDGFTDGLLGAQKNVDKSGKVTFPDGYGETTLVDGDDNSENDVKVLLDEKEVTFVFNVKAIYEEVTPENITDAMVIEKFSQSYGVSTVDEFMQAVKEEVAEITLSAYFSDVVYNAGVNIIAVKDRATVQAGDIVKVDYTGYYEGVAFKEGSATEQWIDVSNNCTINASTGATNKVLDEGFSDGLIGAQIGVEKSYDVTLLEEYGEGTLVDGDDKSENDVKVDLSNKKVTYKFNVKEIYIEVTPETITDEIVAENFSENYEVSTVDEFIKMLKGELAYQYIINYMIGNSTFDISEDYLELRVEEYQALFEELYCTDIDLTSYLEYYGTTLDTVKVQWAATVQNQIKTELVFAEVVKKENLKVNEKALEEYVTTIKNASITEEGNSFFAEENNIYKMIGVGNAKCGKEYYLNQNAVHDYILEIYQ